MVQTLGFNQILILLEAFRWTLALAAIAFVCGAVGGLGIALIRTSVFGVLRRAAATFIIVFQGTPLLMQLFVIYYGLPLLNVTVNAWIAVAIGLTLHASAYLGEIWRSTIMAMPKGQEEAAKALGLKYWDRTVYIVLPQALRMALPSTVGFLVQLIKGTSLAAIIGFTELTRAGQIVSNATYQPLIVFSLVGALYFALCWPLSHFSFNLEKRFANAR
ncbi:amino acid ABC transporter permease [Phyllobacterium brassicacearum]|uniref:Amino acid ABC transporter permease n=1 Tax=Phyllobacterium brassicacearum TaxID=314235 RepID=A0A2P7B6E6_9HYPH|nr:amino acid ABC transporter permease [Phyllobacterium brassicacearum]PSH62047.1 amino acid ABC transporter permease [Phyllobacterium brassicacearum]TDQ16712.1 amino acid ABC transporter membrane protein 2 (PAAT family) [Phyllobacterium brassicacearum]